MSGSLPTPTYRKPGDITWVGGANLNVSAGESTVTLTLTANHNITVEANTIIDVKSGVLNLDFNTNASGPGPKTITLDTGVSVHTNGGFIDLFSNSIVVNDGARLLTTGGRVRLAGAASTEGPEILAGADSINLGADVSIQTSGGAASFLGGVIGLGPRVNVSTAGGNILLAGQLQVSCSRAGVSRSSDRQTPSAWVSRASLVSEGGRVRLLGSNVGMGPGSSVSTGGGDLLVAATSTFDSAGNVFGAAGASQSIRSNGGAGNIVSIDTRGSGSESTDGSVTMSANGLGIAATNTQIASGAGNVFLTGTSTSASEGSDAIVGVDLAGSLIQTTTGEISISGSVDASGIGLNAFGVRLSGTTIEALAAPTNTDGTQISIAGSVFSSSSGVGVGFEAAGVDLGGSFVRTRSGQISISGSADLSVLSQEDLTATSSIFGVRLRGTTVEALEAAAFGTTQVSISGSVTSSSTGTGVSIAAAGADLATSFVRTVSGGISVFGFADISQDITGIDSTASGVHLSGTTVEATSAAASQAHPGEHRRSSIGRRHRRRRRTHGRDLGGRSDRRGLASPRPAGTLTISGTPSAADGTSVRTADTSLETRTGTIEIIENENGGIVLGSNTTIAKIGDDGAARLLVSGDSVAMANGVIVQSQQGPLGVDLLAPSSPSVRTCRSTPTVAT